MSTTALPTADASRAPSVGQVDMKLEVVTIPVSDVERAKAFYEGVIDRQDAELDEQQTEIRDLKGGMAALNKRLTDQDGRLADCRKTCRALARRLGDDPDAADF